MIIAAAALVSQTPVLFQHDIFLQNVGGYNNNKAHWRHKKYLLSVSARVPSFHAIFKFLFKSSLSKRFEDMKFRSSRPVSALK